MGPGANGRSAATRGATWRRGPTGEVGSDAERSVVGAGARAESRQVVGAGEWRLRQGDGDEAGDALGRAVVEHGAVTHEALGLEVRRGDAPQALAEILQPEAVRPIPQSPATSNQSPSKSWASSTIRVSKVKSSTGPARMPRTVVRPI